MEIICNPYPVSYTHLDVYKRQVTETVLSGAWHLEHSKKYGPFWCPHFGQIFTCINPVSYTHLDVYKRQLFLCSGIIDTRAEEVADRLRQDGWEIWETNTCLLYTSRCV